MLPRVLALLLAALLTAGAAFGENPAIFSQVDEMLAGLSQITGWKVRRKVPAQVLKKETFRQYVDKHMKDAAGDKEVQAQEIVLKMFGMVPADFNLARESADLVTEQAAAFYDYTKRRLFLLDSTSDSAEQRMALVHELAHALADQQYPLGKYMREGIHADKGDKGDDDAATARQAVVEGQASWLSWAYLSLRNGGRAEVPQKMLDQLTQVGAEGADFPVFTGAPLYIRESLVFPYSEGMRFQDAIYRDRGRDAFDEVFRHAPQSTQQILHPASFLAGVAPRMVEPPALGEALNGDQPRDFRVRVEGSLGEFDFSALLRQYVDSRLGADTASHMRGGAYRLYQNKHALYHVLAYAAVFDSPEGARNYFTLYQQVMRKKWKKLEVAASSATKFSGTGDTGRFILSLEGDKVEAIEGLK